MNFIFSRSVSAQNELRSGIKFNNLLVIGRGRPLGHPDMPTVGSLTLSYDIDHTIDHTI